MMPLLLAAMQSNCPAARYSPETAAETISTPVLAAPTGLDPESDPKANTDEKLFLDVQVNGHSIGKIGEFIFRQGTLLARAGELHDLGFRVPGTQASPQGELIPLSELPGLIWKIDEKSQTLFISIDNRGLLPAVLRPNGLVNDDDHRVIESGSGVTLNYDIVNTLSGGKNGDTGSIDLRAFSRLGVVSSGWIAYAGANSARSGSNKAIRLDSSYTFADVNSLRRYSVGDFITSGIAWTRPLHIEGIQIRSDFSMRPDLVTFPLPSVTGSTAVPSTLNVLTDGNLMVSTQIEAGPFEIPQLPVISGAGTITMTVTNAMGQQVTLSQPFYSSTSLLKPGLQTYALQAGLVRRNWGSKSYDYGKFASAALYRRGLARKLTVEGSAEATVGAVTVGGGGSAQIANLGVLNLAIAASGGSGGSGMLFSAGVQRIGRRFSLGSSAIITNRNFRDVASMNGDGIQRKQLSAFTSLSLRKLGSAGVAYGGLDRDAAPISVRGSLEPPSRSRVVSANYSVQLRHLSIFVSEFKDFASTTGSHGMQFSLTVPFGRRSSATVGATSDGNGQIQIQQTAPQVHDWGYQMYVSAGSSNHEFGQVQYKAPAGLLTAGLDSNDGETSFRVESQGALSLVDHGVFPSNTIYDSFAIVDTGPIPNVRVLQENRLVGRTGTSGRLLVPDLRSFDLNSITIEPTDIPPDVTINNATRKMRPQDRSGVVVRFPIKFSHGALIQLVDDSGVPLPLGCTAKLESTGVTFPVGYDGDAYVEDLENHNKLLVERSDGSRCTLEFDFHPASGSIPSIGPLACREQRP